MGALPKDPGAFADHVASLLTRLYPGRAVQLTGPRELVVDGRRLDLDNLLRLVHNDPEHGREIVENYLERLFAGELVTLSNVDFDFARPRIMPRIQPETIFDHLNREQVAHVPFVNGTAVVFVIDLPQMTVSVTTEQAVRWGVSFDDLDAIARENLNEYCPELELQVVSSREGGKAAIVAQQDGYDAARLLMSGLYERLAPQLGGDFLVATPSRDMFVAVSPKPNDFVRRIQGRVKQDFRRLPYPITHEWFYVTRDGVAGTAA